jgi:anti-repressor protein
VKEVKIVSNLIPFSYNEKQVRVIEKDSEPWFVATDVCDLLDISNPSDAISRLSETMKGVASTDTLGGNQNCRIISEAGLYKLVFTSRKPEAEKFTDWVASEVIPSIRKHGAYMTPETLEKAILNPDFVIDLATRLKLEQQKRAEAEKKVEEQKPMILFAESCIASNDSLLVREVAKLASKKGIVIGEKRLWQKLRDWEVVNSSNEPYQRSMDAGWFEIRQGTYSTPYGSETYRTPKVTPRGQIYIIERLNKEQKGAA